jgi:hypothetical protein
MVLVRFDRHDRLLDDLTIRFHQSDLQARIRRVGVMLDAGRPLTAWSEPGDLRLTPGSDGLQASSEAARVSFVLDSTTIGGGRHLQLDIRATSANPGPVRLLKHWVELEVAPRPGVTPQPSDIRWFRNGWQSWSFSGTMTLAAPGISQPRIEWIRRIKEDPLVPASVAPFVSDMIAAIRIGDDALAIGAARQSHFQSIRLDPTSTPLRLTLEIDLDREPMHPGQTLALGSWQLEGEHTATYLVREWAARRSPSAPSPPLAGWCSWYDRKRRISHAYIAETVDRIRSTPELSPLKTVIIDDGYQSRVGDWLTPRQGYGAPVAESARKILDAGLVPGIWVAPFVAQSNSETLRRHPEWVATADGRPCRLGYNPHWRSTFSALDIRNPELMDHLSSVFVELYRAGFRVFKLDYLFPAALPLDRAPGAPGRFSSFREAIATLRRATAPDACFLGCGCPLAPAVGLFDAMRVSTDIDYSWKSPAFLSTLTGDEEMVGIFPAVRNTLSRRTFAPSFWRIDPDCVLLSSGKGTATRQEKQLFARMAALAGDVFLVGDDITRWGASELAAFADAASHLGNRLVPLDAADRTDPTWAFCERPSGPAVVAFNTGSPREMASVQLAHLRSLVTEVHDAIAAPPAVAHLHKDRIDVSPVESRASIVVDLRTSAPGIRSGRSPDGPHGDRE